MIKENQSQDSRNSENDWKGRNWYNQLRKKKSNGSRSRSRSNNQHNSQKPSTNKPIKNEKKEWPTPAKLRTRKGEKSNNFSSIIHPKVLNLSSVSLTPSQIQILSIGLRFTPTPQRNLLEIEKDIEDFTRKLRLVGFFSENPELDIRDSSLVKNKSNFCPPQNRNSTLESVIKFLQKQGFYEEDFKNKSNISKHEWQDI